MGKGILIVIIVILVGALGVSIGSRYVTAPDVVDDIFGTGDTDTGSSDTGTDSEDDGDSVVRCTEEAKICPDGTAVGRVGPSCEFAECPATKAVECTPEQREAEACIEIYQPVCANVNVTCIVAPCPPVQETMSNSCVACANSNVGSYIEGACES